MGVWSAIKVACVCLLAVSAGGATGGPYTKCGGMPEGADVAWAPCPDGWMCRRQNQYYWQCVPQQQQPEQQQQQQQQQQQPQQQQQQPQQQQRPEQQQQHPEQQQQQQELTTANPYATALAASLQFYEAQRSGKLLRSNRVRWRGDSFLSDVHGSKCVTGGYFDAGDNVKFLLPFGWTSTVLAWSLAEFPGGFHAAGQMSHIREALRWAADFAIACYVSGDQIIAHVGDPDADHASWQRPESAGTQGSVMYLLDSAHPGSDVAGVMASALASASVALREADARFSNRTLRYAMLYYDFGRKNQGKYSESHPVLAKFYKSSSYHDELAWAAAWLWRATGNSAYRKAAEEHLRSYVAEVGVPWNNFDWDSAYWGVLSLLGARGNVSAFVDAWMQGKGGVMYTPRGLAWSFEWGSLRHNGNAVLYALINNRGNQTVRCWAKGQLDYVLGLRSSAHSFVVGVGRDPPCRPHHRGASCRVSCSWDDFNAAACNPNMITGALVGGPGKDDSYADDRKDFQKNEVALDYNAGFTGALAALLDGGDMSHCV